MDMELTNNTVGCIIKTSNFTSYTATNICDGSVHHVPYGSVDMVLGALLLFIVCFLVLALVIGYLFFIREVK